MVKCMNFSKFKSEALKNDSCVIEWCWVHSTITGNRFFLYLNTKLKYLFAVKICCLTFPKFIHSYTSYNVTVYIK